MNITINGENLDFSLENESTAGEVADGVAGWLEKTGMIIGGISLDGKAALLADELWRKTPIETIGSMDFEALSYREGVARRLETARDYFILLKESAEAGNIDALSELSKSYVDLNHIMPSLLDEKGRPALVPLMEERLAEAGFPLEAKGETDLTAIAAEATNLAVVLDARWKEAADPEKEAASASAALLALSGSLEDVAVLLQTGKDKRAMDTIIRLTELLQALMRSLKWINYDESVEKIIEDFAGILSELEEALKAGDTILIGDLMEYEIKPRLEELPDRLHKGKAAT